MRRLRWVANSVLFILLWASTGNAQAAPNPALQPSTGELPSAATEDDSMDAQFPGRSDQMKTPGDQRAEKLQEKERQKQRWLEIKKESEKLLEVATELKQYVDKAGEGVVSLEVLRKAEQMEKLSKDLQKRMKSGY